MQKVSAYQIGFFEALTSNEQVGPPFFFFSLSLSLSLSLSFSLFCFQHCVVLALLKPPNPEELKCSKSRVLPSPISMG